MKSPSVPNRVERKVEPVWEPLRAAVDSISEGFVLWDTDDRLVLFNPKYVKMYPGITDILQPGAKFEDVIRTCAERDGEHLGGMSVEEYVRWRVELHRRLSGPFEYHLNDGRCVLVNEWSTSEGCTVSVHTDITDLKHRESDLTQKSTLLQAIFDNIAEGISVFDKDLRLVAWNDQYLEAVGLPRKLARVGAPIEELLRYRAKRGSYGPAETESHVRKRMKHFKRFPSEVFEVTRPDGRIFEGRRQPFPGGGIVTTYTDVTERKCTEEALRESQTWQKHAQHVAKVGHWVWYGPNINDWIRDCGKGYRPPMISDEVARIFGIARNQTFEGEIKQEWETHPDDVERCAETLERAEREQSSYDIEYRIVHPDGDVRTVHEIGELLHDEVGDEHTWVGVVQDVSAQTRLEADLISSESRYRDLFEQSPIGIWEEDYSAVKEIIDGLRRRGVRNFRRYFRKHPKTLRKAIKAIRVLDVNQAILDIYRAPNKEAFLGAARKFAQQAAEASFYEQELAALAEGSTRLTIEHTVEPLEGSDILVRSTTHIPEGTKDTWSLVISTEEDITERKQAEEALRESEARLAKAQRIAKVGHWVWDEKEDRESYCSGEGERIFGVPHEWLSSNFEEFLAMVHPNDRERVGALMNKAQKDRTGYEVEYKIARPDGETKFIHEVAEAELDDGGELVRTVGTVQDITERKKAEEALRESEARLNRAQQIACIGNFEWDATTNSVMYRSAIICDIYGVTPEKAPRTLDETVEFMHPDDRERVRAEFTAATAAGEGYDVEYRIVRPDGEIRCIHELSRLVFDETGVIIRSVGTFQDITRRKRFEEALRESEERLKAFVDHAPAQVFLKDTDGRYVLVNREFERHYGVTAEKAKGKTAYDLFPTDVADNFSAHDRKVVETRRAIEREQLVPYADSLHTLFVVKFPILDTAGAFAGIGGIATDITERKQTDAQLIQASKLATLGEMATAMAHELNQPLNVIRMAADNVIERIEDDELDAQYLLGKFNRISAQTERAAAIIDHMRIFGRKVDEKPEYLDPREVINNALGLVREQLQLRAIGVETVFPDRCRKILGHSVQLEQVLLDIIFNARDAIEANRRSPGDPGKISLIVEDTDSDDKIRLVVKDTGGGIPENVMTRVFEPFFTTKGVGKGTGLGLSIGYGIVSEMGGTIEAANAEYGAVITITLPAAEEHNEAA